MLRLDGFVELPQTQLERRTKQAFERKREDAEKTAVLPYAHGRRRAFPFPRATADRYTPGMPDTTCPSCGGSLPTRTRFCGHCGVDMTSAPSPSASPTMAATATSVPDTPSGPSLEPEQVAGRFASGTMISERYRIVGLLGRGGMGEVYRADDLKLGQPVALKFLPGHLERDPSRLARFLNEVRTALKVSHPNVCRVHDINEVGGRHYISMEFVDGDDLGTLLRRIGRFPADRATEVARQLCAGLAAAHAEGILHRDLKPANVMIDGRGQVKVTDFGLSALAEDVQSDDVFAGTPTYMAPEQLAGNSVSIQSDIYALGLVLYEIYSGKSAYQGATIEELRRKKTSAPTTLSSLISDVDPAVERVVQRCLEREPGDRPPSALAVAAALPGGDPLADALAAGETPDARLVAEAGATGGLLPRIAVACLVAVLALLLFNIGTTKRNSLIARADLPRPPAVLAEKARELIRELGYDDEPADSLFTYEVNSDYYSYLTTREEADRWGAASASQPSLVVFGYRQSPGAIYYNSAGSIGDWINRSVSTDPGAVSVFLDMNGRLLRLDAVPPDRMTSDLDESGDPPVPSPKWEALLRAAGFDPNAVTEVDPEWLPGRWSDQRRAWTGVYPDASDVDVRIEAAAYRGRPVSFRVVEPWSRPREAPAPTTGAAARVGGWITMGWFMVVLIGAGLVAWRNARLGRGDHRTAIRFALLLAAIRFVWFLGAHHLPSGGEINVLRSHLAWSLLRFGLAYVFYLALEPYARKIWPHMLTSWVRLFDRRFRDPLVGRDLLIGVVFGLFSTFIARLPGLVAESLGLSTYNPMYGNWTLEVLRGPRHLITAIAGVQTESLLDTFIGVMMIFILRIVLRRTWVTIAVITPLALVMFYPGGNWTTYLIASAMSIVLFWFVFLRFGLLTVAVGFAVDGMLNNLPLTLDLTRWWSGPTWFTLLLVGGLTAWGFWTALAGRPVFKDEVLNA